MSSPLKKEWKKTQITEAKFNDEIYAVLNAALVKYRTTPPHERYNDARLVAREILINIYKHNTSSLIIGLEVEVSSSDHVQIKIYHDGDGFDPFEPANDCKLLLQLNCEYKFNAKFIATDSGRHRLNLKMDLSMVLGGI